MTIKQKKEKIVVIAGEFDNITSDDIIMLNRCKSRGDWLIIGLHSDWWLQTVSGKNEKSFLTRKETLSNIKSVDEVLIFNDLDGTVCNLLKIIKFCYPGSEITYLSEDDMFNMPETKIHGISFEKL